eukprot:COSAG01_NODE_316_length_19004_cov_100.001322_18_plen_81_part_00
MIGARRTHVTIIAVENDEAGDGLVGCSVSPPAPAPSGDDDASSLTDETDARTDPERVRKDMGGGGRGLRAPACASSCCCC